MNAIASVLKKLNGGKPTIGTWMQLPCSDVAEILGHAGYDWVAVDLEHGGFSLPAVKNICRALELGGTAPVARVAQCHPKDIKQALDSGVQGIILPMIENRDQLEDGIRWVYTPPEGTRGMGYSRANLFGKDFNKYIEKTALKILVVAQIEHINAVYNLDEILSVRDLDAIMVGPYDLSGSMELTGQFSHPDFLEITDNIFDKAREYNVPMGLHIVQPDKELLLAKVAEGYQFIAYGIDAVFLYNSAEKPEIK